MKKIRINELARELEVKAHEILDLLPELGVTEKKTHSSSIDEDVALKLKRHYGFDVTEPSENGDESTYEDESVDETPAPPAPVAATPAAPAVPTAPAAPALPHVAREERPAPDAVPATPAPAPTPGLPIRPPIGTGKPIHPPIGGHRA